MIYAAILLIFLAVFFWCVNLGVLILARDWPLLLVVVGFLQLVKVIRSNNRKVIIDRLTRGKISAEDAIKLLKQDKR